MIPLDALIAKLRPEQKEAVDAGVENLLAGNRGAAGSLLLVSPTGTGKCLRVGTNVLMSQGGSIRVEDVQEGDRLLGPDGRVRTVVSITRGIAPLYRVTPTKGVPYDVTGEHLLSLRHTVTGDVVNTTVLDYATWTKSKKHVYKGWRSGKVRFEKEETVLPVPPYILGLWLGDGTTVRPEITCDIGDTEILTAWADYGASIGAEVVLRPKTGTRAIKSVLSAGRPGKGHPSRNALVLFLNDQGLTAGKFIPGDYLTSTEENRRQLLAGLLDTDGHLSGGGFDYISVRKELADGVAFLARSLGLAAYVRQCTKSCQNDFIGEYWRVFISGDCDAIPNRVPRKKAGPRKQKKNVLNVGIAVEAVGEGEYAGFELDGDHLFLLEDFTVTHNSFIQGAIHRIMTETHGRTIYSTFPQSEIAEAVFAKTYGTEDDWPLWSVKNRQKKLEAAGFWTIKRLHNELVKGNIPVPKYLQTDEAHHSTDDTHELVHGICGLCPRVGATATDYRGTAVETSKFRERWPRSHRVLTLRNAVALGRLSMPSWSVWPLLNDELIDVTNGEFSVRSVESHLVDKLDDLVDRIRPLWRTHCKTCARPIAHFSNPGSLCACGEMPQPEIDRPTMIAVPGVSTVSAVVQAINGFTSLRAVGVTGDSSDAERTEAFRACIAREAILVQIRVVGEGVDLPIRRLIDLAPTTSPVLWMQRVGRITRPIPSCRRCGGTGLISDPEGLATPYVCPYPHEAAPEYIACCHNLARHAYLWHGVMPPTAVRDAQEAWGKDFKPSRRMLARAIDVEGLGRFQPAGAPLADGTIATLYVMQSKDGLQQYAVCLHPLRPDPWFFARENQLTGKRASTVVNGVNVEYNEKAYGSWKRVDRLPELTGMQTLKPTFLTPKQEAWWKKDAAKKGLDPEATITNREFQLLPILFDSRTRLEV